MGKFRIEIICCLIFVLFDCYNATLSKSDRKSKNEKKITKMNGQRGFGSHENNNMNDASVDYQSILDENKSYSFSASLVKNFNQDVLGYVTPWNNHGYDVAKLYAAKFTMISPVWFQLKSRDPKGSFSFEGLQDIDRNWVATLKHLNKNVRVVPRIILEQWTYANLKKFLKDKVEELSIELTLLSTENYFDGYVLEIWSILGGRMKAELTQFIVDLAKELQKQKLILILVIPPPLYAGNQGGMFVRQDFEKLAKHVTAFSLMSYDYSNPERPGPNSPLTWLLQCVEDLVPNSSSPYRKKLLLGLNFYGNLYSKLGGKPIIGHEYLSILEKHKPNFVFNNVSGEHSFTYWTDNSEHEVFYPTLHSIRIRLQLARELKTGVAIWETGQGLNYFYDLL